MNPATPTVPMAAPAATPQATNFDASSIFAPAPASTPGASILPTAPNVQFKAPDAINLPSIDFGQFGTNVAGASTAVSKANSDLIAQQQAQKTGVFNQYQQAVTAFGNPSDIYNKLSDAYGIPLYQQQMASLRTLLSHLNDDVTTRVQGSNLNAAQRDKLYAVEQQPLNQQLGDIGNYLGNATSNLTTQLDLYNKGEQQALDPFKTYLGSLDSTFGNQLSALGSSSSAGVDAVKAALNKQLQEQQIAESKYEADSNRALQEKLASLKAPSGTGVGSYLGAPGGGTSAKQPQATQRNGGGFNFTDASGAAISAGKYAAATGTPIGQLLYQMGQNGDKYAMQAYNQIKANQAWYNANPNVLKSEFGPLFWGT